MDRIDAMRAFVRVVETGSFTRAAQTLGINRASLTQMVQQLEARLRVKLLNRTTRKVNATEDGRVYYERVVHLLQELEAIEAALPGALADPEGELRIDVPSPLASLVLIPALPAFHAAYPRIRFDLGASDRKVDLIGDNVDCVIRGGEIREQSLVARRVAELPLGLYAAPAYLARHGMPAHPADLDGAAHAVVRFKWSATGEGFPYAMRKAGETVRMAGRHVVTIDDGNAYLAAGLAGLGALWLPGYMARAGVADGRLVPLFADWECDRMPLYIAYPPNRHPSRKLRVFMDWIARLLAQM